MGTDPLTDEYLLSQGYTQKTIDEYRRREAYCKEHGHAYEYLSDGIYMCDCGDAFDDKPHL